MAFVRERVISREKQKEGAADGWPAAGAKWEASFSEPHSEPSLLQSGFCTGGATEADGVPAAGAEQAGLVGWVVWGQDQDGGCSS